eukprot:jgi/Hompol1/3906/HPOL_006828-RA
MPSAYTTSENEEVLQGFSDDAPGFLRNGPGPNRLVAEPMAGDKEQGEELGASGENGNDYDGSSDGSQELSVSRGPDVLVRSMKKAAEIKHRRTSSRA